MNCEQLSEMISVGALRYATNCRKLRTQDSAEKSGKISKNKERVQKRVQERVQERVQQVY